MKNILFRASKTPFDFFDKESIKDKDLISVYKKLKKPGTKNIGNLVFANAVYKALSTSDTKIDIDNYDLTLHDNYIEKADYINNSYDAFVLPLCNSFRVGYKETLIRMTKTLKKINIPCVVTGVGAQIPLGKTDFSNLTPIKDEVKDFVYTILDRSHSIGVRGEITRDYLISLGVPNSQIDVIGCPSMFFHGKNLKIDKKPNFEKLAINLSSIKNPLFNHFLNIVDNHPNTTYIPQVRNLMPLCAKKNFEELTLEQMKDLQVPNLIKSGNIKFLCDFLPWLNFLKTQDFIIGSRIHGNVVGLLAGKPAHVIIHDSRTFELCKYFEIPHTSLNDLENFNLLETYEKSDYTNMIKNHDARLSVYASFLEKNGLSHILYNDKLLTEYDQNLQKAILNS